MDAQALPKERGAHKPDRYYNITETNANNMLTRKKSLKSLFLPGGVAELPIPPVENRTDRE